MSKSVNTEQLTNKQIESMLNYNNNPFKTKINFHPFSPPPPPQQQSA